MSTVCAVCEEQLGFLNNRKLKDAAVCKACYEKAGLKGVYVPGWELGLQEFLRLYELPDYDQKAYIESKRYEASERLQFPQAPPSKITQAPETVSCPKCGSTSISANQKSFGVGKAVVGAVAFGALGLVAGGAGARKIRITCLNCGHQWQAGKH